MSAIGHGGPRMRPEPESGDPDELILRAEPEEGDSTEDDGADQGGGG